MKDLEKILKKENYLLQEYNLASQIGIDFWHSTLKDRNGRPISSGFGQDKQTSRKIAVSEFLERRFFRETKYGNSETQKKWGLDILSTGCGFAVGYNPHNTVLRSIGEGVERWVMSKWIDEHYYIEELNLREILLELDCPSKWFFQQFESVKIYNKQILINAFKKYLVFNVTICVGVIKNGVFLGSGVAYGLNNKNFQHSLLESFRHLSLCRNTKAIEEFPDNKVRFFSKNGLVAHEQIKKAKFENWPVPKIKFFNFEERVEEGFCLARTIIDGWTCWKQGPIERFLY